MKLELKSVIVKPDGFPEEFESYMNSLSFTVVHSFVPVVWVFAVNSIG